MHLLVRSSWNRCTFSKFTILSCVLLLGRGWSLLANMVYIAPTVSVIFCIGVPLGSIPCAEVVNIF